MSLSLVTINLLNSSTRVSWIS